MLKSSVPSNSAAVSVPLGLAGISAGLTSRPVRTAEQHIRHRAQIRRERSILFPLLGAALLLRFCLTVVKVDGHSMEPTYHTGDTLYILKPYRFVSPLKPGDVVVAHLNHGRIRGESIVKRVVFVQNSSGNAPWPVNVKTPGGPTPFRNFFASYVSGARSVRPGEIIVMGDNYENSMDSRDFGPVRSDEVMGKVLNP